jgi:lipoyl(octanoyl) transferase
MSFAAPLNNSTPRVLQAYLLGRVELDPVLTLQRRLIYEVGGERSNGFLLLCEHPNGVTLGREGSLGDILLGPSDMRSRGWDVRRVNRGGGSLLHAPGQLAAYSILALDAAGLTLQEYVDRLHGIIRNTLIEMEIPAEWRLGSAGVWVGNRRIAHVGVAVRDWVAYFGFAINIHPDLEIFRYIRCGGDARPMTSVQRERRLPVRPATVRQRILESFANAFDFERVALFHNHPSLTPKAPAHAVASGSR